MSDHPLDIGMLGYGFMGRAHANAIARLPMFFDDAPICTRHVLIGRTESKVAEAADRLGFDHTATDWRSVIDEIDVLYNLGPNHVHEEPSIAALESDTPVFCEKPLAPTGEATERMAATADRTSAPAGVAFNYRFVPAIQYAKALIEDGEIGEIRHFRGRYLQDWLVDPDTPWSWRNDTELAGSGALGDLGSHTVDLARYLVGEIDSVSGHLRTFIDERPTEDGTDTKPVTVDDAYSAQVQFDTGTMGTLEASRVADGHKNDHTIEIAGSKGSLRFSLERLNELEVLRDGHRGYETILVTDPDDPYLDHWWPPGHVLGWEHTFVHENYEFLRSIEAGDQFAPSFADGRAVQRVLDAIEESDARGEWVSV
jgi:predicted dehydrogenase